MEQQLHLLTGSYALNALSDEERRDFERHALGDAETLEEVRSLSETAALLAYGVPAETPPQALKADVMAAIRNTRQLPASSVVRDLPSHSASRPARRAVHRPLWRPVVAAAAALVVLAGVGLGGWAVGTGAGNKTMQQELAMAQEQQQAMLRIMNAPDAKIGTSRLAGGDVVTFASSVQADQAAIMVDAMPPLPEGKSYELWFISASGAVPAGLMDSPKAPAMQLLDGPLGSATHIGITVEPAGGSPAPTTEPILVHTL